jgi:glycosyltransferase involved in cell wall biosynthesis
MRPGLSGCVIAMNEEDRIGDCLASLDFCDEILVVDSHSTDRTRDVAAARGARVIERDWPGFVAQRAFAMRSAEHDWILYVDADERVSAELRAEIERARAAGFGDRAGYEFPRCTYYLGAFVRHGAWYPDRQLRLFDRRRARSVGEEPHGVIAVDGPVGRLRGDLLHYSYRDLGEHVQRIDRYTTIMARGMAARGRRASAADLVTHPLAKFVCGYLVKRGFLDGWRGLLIACLSSYYTHLKYAKLLVASRGASQGGR